MNLNVLILYKLVFDVFLVRFSFYFHTKILFIDTDRHIKRIKFYRETHMYEIPVLDLGTGANAKKSFKSNQYFERTKIKEFHR